MHRYPGGYTSACIHWTCKSSARRRTSASFSPGNLDMRTSSILVPCRVYSTAAEPVSSTVKVAIPGRQITVPFGNTRRSAPRPGFSASVFVAVRRGQTCAHLPTHRSLYGESNPNLTGNPNEIFQFILGKRVYLIMVHRTNECLQK